MIWDECWQPSCNIKGFYCPSCDAPFCETHLYSHMENMHDIPQNNAKVVCRLMDIVPKNKNSF